MITSSRYRVTRRFNGLDLWHTTPSSGLTGRLRFGRRSDPMVRELIRRRLDVLFLRNHRDAVAACGIREEDSNAVESSVFCICHQHSAGKLFRQQKDRDVRAGLVRGREDKENIMNDIESLKAKIAEKLPEAKLYFDTPPDPSSTRAQWLDIEAGGHEVVVESKRGRG